MLLQERLERFAGSDEHLGENCNTDAQENTNNSTDGETKDYVRAPGNRLPENHANIEYHALREAKESCWKNNLGIRTEIH